MVDPGTEDAVLVRARGVLQLTGKHTARIRIAELAEKGTLVEPRRTRLARSHRPMSGT